MYKYSGELKKKTKKNKIKNPPLNQEVAHKRPPHALRNYLNGEYKNSNPIKTQQLNASEVVLLTLNRQGHILGAHRATSISYM